MGLVHLWILQVCGVVVGIGVVVASKQQCPFAVGPAQPQAGHAIFSGDGRLVQPIVGHWKVAQVAGVVDWIGVVVGVKQHFFSVQPFDGHLSASGW